MKSGLYRELTEKRLLIAHDEVDALPRVSATAYRVIRPELVSLISYPFEWSFSQYKDAALLTLAVERQALRRGMSLKDCSAYNVQFHEGRPIFIDTLSLEQYHEGRPWVAYRQFCQHFLAPLALMSLTDIRLGQLCRTNLDGIPLDLATRLLPWRSRVRFGLALHLHLHGLVQHSDAQTRESGSPGRFSQSAMLGLIASLESTVQGLSWKPGRSTWVAYSKESTYSPDQVDWKGRFIAEFLELVRPASVWDLGANTGNFSRLASERGIPTVAFDFDPACVEVNYREVKKRQETKLLPLLVDLLNPSPACGWVNRERTSIFQRGRPELVLALALIHHLAIAGNLPLENIAEFFSDLAPWLVIEFVAPDDSQVQRLIAQRKGVHHPYDQTRFETCFKRYFSIQEIRPIPPGGRILYLMRRKDDEPSSDG
jgi:ribosomal protein L11 methylase PrmA